MKKRIFEKDENGNFIINFANIDADYYALAANDDSTDLDVLSFFVLSFYDDGDDLLTELKNKRLIDERTLQYRVKEQKRSLLDFSKKHLKKFNPELTDEDSEKNLLAILDEYEKILEYKTLCALVGKKEITPSDMELVDRKRQAMYEALIGVKDIHAFVGGNLELAKFILNNKNFDELITKAEQENGKEKKYSFHYEFLRKSLSVEQIEEARRIVLDYKKKFKLDNVTAISDFFAYCEIGTTERIFDRKRELVKLIAQKEKEYEKDLKKQERDKKREAQRIEREKQKKEEAKRRKEAEKFFDFETSGPSGSLEIVVPLAINFIGRRGQTITESIGEEKVSELFDTIKGINFRRNERPLLIILSDCSREEALRVLADFRNQAKVNGLDERFIEGITTEFGKELVFDENTSRKLISGGSIDENLIYMRAYKKEQYPDLVELNPDRSYLTYSLEKYKNKPKKLEKLFASLKGDSRILRYILDDNNGILYGVPKEKAPSRVRKRIAEYLKLKYSVREKFLDAFKQSKKLAEYEIDRDDEEGEEYE